MIKYYFNFIIILAGEESDKCFCVCVKKKMRMYSKIPLIMESMPRQKSFGCLSLRLGSLFSGLVIILYTVLALAQCLATLDKQIPGPVDTDHWDNVFLSCFEVAIIICHCITLVLTTIMLVGVLREKAHLMKPWIIWTSCIVIGNLLLIVFCTVLMVVISRLHVEPSVMLYYLIGFVELIFRIYMLSLVSSHYLELVEERVERLRTLISADTWHNNA